MKSIAFLISTMSEGGAQRVAANLANRLCGRYDVSLLTLWDKGCVYKLDPRIKTYSFRVDPGSFTNHFPKSNPIFSRVLWSAKMKTKIRPEVSISLLPAANLVNVLSPAGDRRITSERSDPSALDTKHYLMEKTAMSLADHTVFQSEYVRKQYSKFVKDKSTIILNPVSVPCTAAEIRMNRIVSAGRLVPQKNHKLLIDAFSEFRKVHPDYTLEIYGSGELEQNLKDQIRDLGLTDRVILHGFVKDIHEQIRNAKMFVLSSDFEGLSNALLESMMMGIACISTKVAGSTEIIKSMENGILTDVGDREGLTAAMLMLAGDDEFRKKLEKNAQRTAAGFKTESITAQWEALL